MKFVIQRVNHASVTVDSRIVGSIGRGFLVLIGVCNEDTEATADKLVKKMLGLRIFEDSEGKTNLSLESVAGDLLLVSQFTLYADCRKGNRPSFTNAGSPEHAEKLYDYIVDSCRKAVGMMNENRRTADEAWENLTGANEENKSAEDRKNNADIDLNKIDQKVETGIFGAEMKVELENDGPFTIILDSGEL